MKERERVRERERGRERERERERARERSYQPKEGGHPRVKSHSRSLQAARCNLVDVCPEFSNGFERERKGKHKFMFRMVRGSPREDRSSPEGTDEGKNASGKAGARCPAVRSLRRPRKSRWRAVRNMRETKMTRSLPQCKRSWRKPSSRRPSWTSSTRCRVLHQQIASKVRLPHTTSSTPRFVSGLSASQHLSNTLAAAAILQVWCSVRVRTVGPACTDSSVQQDFDCADLHCRRGRSGRTRFSQHLHRQRRLLNVRGRGVRSTVESPSLAPHPYAYS